VIRVDELTLADRPAAARVAADGFVEDPYWLALAPLPVRWRHALIRDMTMGELAALGEVNAAHGGGACVGAFDDNALVGLARVAEEREHTPARWPPRAILGTGPLGVARWRRAEARLAALLPSTPHDYLYTIAVAPGRQGLGLGRRLLEWVIARAAARRMPVLLDTMSPANLPFYAHFGFQVIGEYPLARGYRAWVLGRDAEPAGHWELDGPGEPGGAGDVGRR
jgi:GNAT superfamily N-acetyltransferase